MNKFVNILMLLILMPTAALTIFVGFDLPVEFIKTTGKNIPHKETIFLAFAGILFIVGARRAIRRWMGIRLVNQLAKFKWNFPMNKARIKQVNLYLYLETLLHVFVGVALYVVAHEAFAVSIVMLVLGIEHLIFAFVGNSGKKFRTGITSSAIVVADRDIKIAYFSGLRKVSIQQQSIFFDYIEELQISFPLDCISSEERASFRNMIESRVNRDKVFFTEGFKSL